jgi:TPR repeat protein
MAGLAMVRYAMSRCGVAGLALLACWAPAFGQAGQMPLNLPGPAASYPAIPQPMQLETPNYLKPGVQTDLAFGAYQRGYYVTALREAMKRIDANPADGPAMTLVGQLYKDGMGVRLNLTEAARWYKLAAEHGDPQGAFALAMAYLRGAGVKTDPKAARPLLEQAAAAGHSGALYNLGLMNIDEDLQDFAKAAGYFQRAVDLGNMDAAYALALLYRDGRGVRQDPAKAGQFLKMAADENIVAAQVEYAIMLFNGDGIPKDEPAAARYFAKASASNNPVAANRLARLLATGRGVGRNMVEAMKWHLLARAAGIKDEWLDSQLNSLSPRDRAAVEEALRRQVGAN